MHGHLDPLAMVPCLRQVHLQILPPGVQRHRGLWQPERSVTDAALEPGRRQALCPVGVDQAETPTACVCVAVSLQHATGHKAIQQPIDGDPIGMVTANRKTTQNLGVAEPGPGLRQEQAEHRTDCQGATQPGNGEPCLDVRWNREEISCLGNA